MKKEIQQKKIKARKRLIIETFVFVFIVSSPFFFKLHEFFSSNPEATIEFFGFVIDRNGFKNLNIYVWFMLGKMVPMSLLVIWFFTCRHWWYHAILIPISMYAFQIFEVIFTENEYIDTENLLWLLPICMVVIPFVYFIRIKLYDRHVHGIDLEALEIEIKALKEKKAGIDRNEDLEDNSPEIVDHKSIPEWLNEQFSTENLHLQLRQFQSTLRNWLHF